MLNIFKIFLLFFLLANITVSAGLSTRHTIKGHITDASSGEVLPGATVQIESVNKGTTTNNYGFYSINLKEGAYKLKISYIGYNTEYFDIELNSNESIDFELEPIHTDLAEVVITDERADRHITDVRMSTSKLSIEKVRSIPAFMGETDILKTLHLLPGVSWGAEGTTGFFVRGGGQDQNMILLDEAPIYNASHLMGFFSVFNPDVIRDFQLYKGGIPAQYGGRLSSVLDIRMNDGNNREFKGTGGIGTISSRLTLEGPLKKDTGSFIVSGRRTYADLFLPLSSDPNLQNNQLFFYDLNAKANYRFNKNNRLFVSGYFGKDVFRFDDIFGFKWGNTSSTLRWNHIFNSKLFSNFTFVYSNYDYNLHAEEGMLSVDWASHIEDITLKGDFTWYPNPENTVKFGLHSTSHSLNPGHIIGIDGEEPIAEYKMPNNYALHHSLYASNKHKLSENITVEYGLRYSLFQNIGEATIYSYDKNYNVTDTSKYASGEIFDHHHGLEPRIAMVYQLDEKQSVKANYNRTRQYLHQATNTTAATPLDVWFPSSPNVKPQIADQWAIGYFRNFYNNTFESSLELYYKNMKNQIDFRENASLLLNPYLESELRTGKAWAYGAEFMINKTKGDFTGWISYTWSKTMRKIPAINNGEPYPAAYDRPHDISLVLSYDVNQRINASASWTYNTGRPITMPAGKFEYKGLTLPTYSKRNSERLPDYHRLDLSLTIKTTRQITRNWEGKWNISVYNAYYRKNVFSYYFDKNEDNPGKTQAYKIFLFGIIPAVSYNFSF